MIEEIRRLLQALGKLGHRDVRARTIVPMFGNGLGAAGSVLHDILPVCHFRLPAISLIVNTVIRLLRLLVQNPIG